MGLADQLTPKKARLIVREDARSDIIADLGDGRSLVRPERSGDKQRCRSGVVLKAGPQAMYKAGDRVLFGAYSATSVSAGGGVVLFLDSGDVDAVLGGEEDPDSEPGPAWIDHLRPPPGELLVQRTEKPLLRGRIHLPPNASSLATRCMEATVLAVDEGVRGVEIGDHVLLDYDVCRSIWLDVRGEHVLSRLDPSQIMADIDVTPEYPVEMGRDLTGVAEELMAQEDVDERFNEGDPAGPR